MMSQRCRFTSAYLVQLVFTTSPLWTSLVGAAAVREAPPPLLWPVFAVTVAGSGGPLARAMGLKAIVITVIQVVSPTA